MKAKKEGNTTSTVDRSHQKSIIAVYGPVFRTKVTILPFRAGNLKDAQLPLYTAVAQLVERRTRNRENPGSNPLCYRFEVWAFSFTSRRLSRLSCINEYLAIDSGGNVIE